MAKLEFLGRPVLNPDWCEGIRDAALDAGLPSVLEFLPSNQLRQEAISNAEIARTGDIPPLKRKTFKETMEEIRGSQPQQLTVATTELSIIRKSLVLCLVDDPVLEHDRVRITSLVDRVFEQNPPDRKSPYIYNVRLATMLDYSSDAYEMVIDRLSGIAIPATVELGEVQGQTITGDYRTEPI